MKKTLIFLLFLGIKFCAIGQLKNISASFSGNVPIIQSASKETNMSIYPPWYMGTSGTGAIVTYTTITVKESYQPKAGFDFSIKADYGITSKLFISTGLTLNVYRFNRNTSININSGYQTNESSLPKGVPVGIYYNGTIRLQNRDAATEVTSSKTDKSTIYLTLPILAGKSFLHDKLIVRAGTSFSYILDAYGYKGSYDMGSNTIKETKSTQASSYNSVLINAVAESTYKITKRMGIDVSVQKSFTPIYKDSNSISRKTKYNIISVGVSYSLLKK